MSRLIFLHFVRFGGHFASSSFKRVLIIHVPQGEGEASGWSQLKGRRCLEKVAIVKPYKIVPETDTGG
jgi:hypothetical protein